MPAIANFLSLIAMSSKTPNMVAVGHLLPDPGWRMQAHHHPFHEIIAPVRGIINVRIHGREHRCGPGTLLLYAAGVAHEEWSDPEAVLESYFMGFRSTELKADDLVTCEDPDGRIRQMLRWMHQDQRALKTGGEIIRQHYLHIVISLFRQGWQPAESEWVQNVRTFIRHHLAEPLSLDDLAREAGCSRYHFVREYRRRTGRTPMADVRRIRADFARDLILTTSLPLKEIAPTAGIANEYTLSRLFRQLYGMPPGEFRRTRRTVPAPATSATPSTMAIPASARL